MFNNTMAAVTPYQTVASTVATSLGQAASAAVVPPSSSNNNNNNNNNSRNGACNQQPPRYRETVSFLIFLKFNCKKSFLNFTGFF
jgi:hypothetical protein